MDWVILGKAVPDADEAGVDLAERRLRRDGVELFLNPFDQRAVRVALDRRGPGERVTLLSMGPPGAVEAFRDPLALGVDRVVLLSDPRLAGSDSLATARALAAAVRRLEAPLVLAGRWSTDAETGQVPAQVAALLARGFLGAARSLERIGPERVTAVVDTETGWARMSAPLPLVVAVGEKIVALRKPTETERNAVDLGRVERWGLAEIRVDASEVGARGSPTVVARLQEVVRRRSPRVFDEGTASDRVRGALEYLRSRSRPPIQTAVADARAGSGLALRGLVSGLEGDVDDAGLSVLVQVARTLPGSRRTAVVVGRPPTAPTAQAVGRAGATDILHVPAEGVVDEGRAATALAATLGDAPTPAAFVFASNEFGRAVAGRLSATLGLGLTGDAIALRVGPDGAPVGVKPAFGGRYLAEVEHRRLPALVTLRTGEPPARTGPVTVPVRTRPVTLPAPSLIVEAAGVEVDPTEPDPGGAGLVLGVGLGVAGPEGVATVRDFARRWGASLGASRKVVDAGWMPRQRQVGLTGRSVAPSLALLVASSARPNQVVGYRQSGAIAVITKDAEAARRADVDVALIGDYAEILGELDLQGSEWLRSVGATRG